MSHPSPATVPAPPTPRSFVLAVFIAGAVLTALVGYLGLSGTLGAGIVGNESAHAPPPVPLTSCQGKGAEGNFHFIVVAGLKGSETFNGSSPGPCIAVAVGSTVEVTFEVSSEARSPDSWVLIPGEGATNVPPVFAGAGPSSGSRLTGLFPGGSVNYTFNASVAGDYRYVSEVGDHARVGMWGPLNVTSSSLTVGASLSGSRVSPLEPRVDFFGATGGFARLLGGGRR
jgi:FtsP/CotA-like multicopper oxidase with cupredoxin domain